MGEKGPGHEEKQKNIETAAEHLPNEAEVREIFNKLIDGAFVERRKIADEKGLYLWEVEIPGKLSGETTEYAYRRDLQGKTNYNGITITNFEDGMPVGGKNVADFIDGKWIMDTKS